MEHATRSRRTGEILFALALGSAALGIGSVPITVLVSVIALFCVAAMFLWKTPLRLTRRAQVTLVAMAAVTAFTALQCIPVPLNLLADIAPHNFDVWSRSLRPLGEVPPRYGSISLDPTATWLEVLRGVGYITCFLGAVQVARNRNGRRLLEVALIGTGILVVAVSIINPLLSPETVYGVYRPKTDVTLVGPMLNINHLAAFTTIALLLTCDSALSERPLAPRALLATLSISLFASIVWFGSRGGVASATFGVALVVGLSLATQRRPGRFVIIGVLVAVIGLMACVIALSPRAAHLATGDVSKIAVATEALHSMTEHYPIFGVGRGAFASTFPEFRRVGGSFVVYTHPENIMAQWVTEVGIPVSLALGLVAFYVLRPRHPRKRNQPAGAWCAVLALLTHDLVDYSLEIPGVAFAGVVCLALVVAGSSSPPDLPRNRMRWGVALLVATVVPLATLTFMRRHRELLVERSAIQAAAMESDGPAFRNQMRVALLDHPAEPYFAYVGAVRAVRDAEAPLPWVEHCVERAPIYPPIHFLLARWLQHRHALSQARFEYRIGFDQNQAVGADAAPDVVNLVMSFDDVLELTPAGKLGVALLDGLAARLAKRLPATRVLIDDEIIKRNPTMVTARERLALDAVADLASSPPAPWCVADAGSCLRDALTRTEELTDAEPSLCRGYELEARARVAVGDTRALGRLVKAADLVSDRVECLKALAGIAEGAHMRGTATSAIDSLLHATCSGDQCVDTLLFCATFEASRGNDGRALELFQKAAHDDSSGDRAMEWLSRFARATGRYDVAVYADSELLRRHPTNATFKQAVVADQNAREQRR